MTTLAKNIRKYRKLRGMSQETVAEKLGYKSYTTIQKWESGDSEPSLSTLHKLAEILRVDVNEFVNPDAHEDKPDLPDRFETAQEAMTFLLRQPAIMGYSGVDIRDMDDDTVLEFANEILNQMKLVSYKYKKE